MKCTGKYFILICFAAGIISMTAGCGAEEDLVSWEKEHYNKNIYEADLYASDLCVASGDVDLEGFAGVDDVHAAGLFDLSDSTVAYGSHLFDRIYPASTTKILTALVALNNSSLDDVVTVSKNAAAASFDPAAQVCGLKAGDQISMEDLLYGLLLHSGNDNAVAIAEYIAGDAETFADMMNAQAADLLATGTHFVTPNGLHDPDHYTTAYDLYLIFNECIKHEEFVKIISTPAYTASITGADGSVRQLTWEPTHFYAKGEAALPEGATVIGGKTGYETEAKDCLILLDEDTNGDRYISIVMGAESKPVLYEKMTSVIDQIPALQ